MKIDLHVHSSASDGALAPGEVVARARSGGLDVLAIADHDTLAGLPEAMTAAGQGLQLIPAIEISASHRERGVHILGYGVDPEHPGMVELARRAREAREIRLREMVDLLAGLDIDITFDAVRDEAGSGASLARPHLARVLWHGGHVGSVAEAFDRYIGDQGPAFVPVRLVDVAGAITIIHEAGGLAVWAHPPMPLLGGALREFVDAGLDGLECYRPRVPPDDLNRLLNKARRHRLVVTGGSDWHGEWHGDLGSFGVDETQVAEFLERLGSVSTG